MQEQPPNNLEAQVTEDQVLPGMPVSITARPKCMFGYITVTHHDTGKTFSRRVGYQHENIILDKWGKFQDYISLLIWKHWYRLHLPREVKK